MRSVNGRGAGAMGSDPEARGRLEGRVALISGGGTGIGAATARRFTAEGARVVLMGRRPEPLEAVAAEIGGVAVPGDSSLPADADRAVHAALDGFGHLDVVVANAGGSGTGPVLETADQAWASSLRSNVATAFVLCRAGLPALIERRG